MPLEFEGCVAASVKAAHAVNLMKEKHIDLLLIGYQTPEITATR